MEIKKDADKGIVFGLKKIHKEGLTSFHMPGHKGGRLINEYLSSDFMIKMDITEIPGSDNLHCPENYVLNTLEKFKQIYGSDKSYMLINGSTVGILSAILSQTSIGDKIIANRFAHKSVHNAIKMNRLNPVYIMPEIDEYGVIRDLEKDWEKLLDNHSDAKVIVLTYPTYEGTVYDLKSVIDEAHRRGMIVVVDEAHGAHFTLSDELPIDALTLGADIVIQSLHKTLPAITQTAILHTVGNRVKEDKLDFYLSSLQSSSPSYIFLQSMDVCAQIMDLKGRALMDSLLMKTRKLISSIEEIGFKVIETDDITKVMISPNCLGYTGSELEEIMRKEYAIQCEYSTDCFALFMVSIGNIDEDFDHLIESLMDLKGKTQRVPIDSVVFNGFKKPIVELKPFELEMHKWTEVCLDDLEGHIIMENIVPYPPGIPLIMGGEKVTDDHIEVIRHLKAINYKMVGVHDQSFEKFRVKG